MDIDEDTSVENKHDGEASIADDNSELEYDPESYILYRQFHTVFPCLSFDLIPDKLGEDRANFYPLTAYLVAGTSQENSFTNSIIVAKVSNLKPNEDDEDEDDEDEEDKMEDEPVLATSQIKHQGCVNRIRVSIIDDHPIAATWSETGKLHLWDLKKHIKDIDSETGARNDYGKENVKQDKPLFTFSGHSEEGYGLDWSTLVPGLLASGGNDNNMFVWKPAHSSWMVDPKPYTAHTASIEDIQWSSTEPHILCTCSADHTVKVWDIRAAPHKAAMLSVEAHNAHVNVISWNKKRAEYLLSGGDDGAIKVWDFRNFKSDSPAFEINYHTKEITSVEWHPVEEAGFAAASADDSVTLWDLAMEKDPNNEDSIDDESIPKELMFVHCGQHEIKEIHWHPQMPDIIFTTALDSFNVFRPNNEPPNENEDEDE